MREWLKISRLDKNLTQSQVAESAGISRAFYTEIENNLKNPSVGTAKRIADILNISWTYFFSDACSEVKHGKQSA